MTKKRCFAHIVNIALQRITSNRKPKAPSHGYKIRSPTFRPLMGDRWHLKCSSSKEILVATSIFKSQSLSCWGTCQSDGTLHSLWLTVSGVVASMLLCWIRFTLEVLISCRSRHWNVLKQTRISRGLISINYLMMIGIGLASIWNYYGWDHSEVDHRNADCFQ